MKEAFRHLCMQLIPEICKRPIPTIHQGLTMESVFVEFRQLPHVETVIRNLITMTGPEWSHSVVCGKSNETFMRKLCGDISEGIKIHVLDIQECSINMYNKLLLNPYFWKLFSGDKILIYQEDTFVFKDNINEFVEYDYIGSPWCRTDRVTGQPSQGNGGFSIRNRRLMIHILEHVDYTDVHIDACHKLHMGRTLLDNYAEDVFFSTVMRDKKLGKLPNAQVALRFCSENVLNTDSCAGHQFWNSDRNWKQRVMGAMNYKIH